MVTLMFMRFRIGRLEDEPVAHSVREVASADVGPEASLLDVLRGPLGLKSVVRGCKNGTCGSCRVLLNGNLVPSCMLLATAVPDMAHIETYEHLANEPSAVAAIDHFERERNSRCSLCVAGLGVTAVHLTRAGTAGDDDAIDRAVAGAHCQCTGRGSLRRSLAFIRQALPVSGTSGS